MGLPSLDAAAFWNDLGTSAAFGSTINAQVEGLRPLWLHSPILAVVLPYGLTNPGRGKAQWLFALASRAFGRPAGHGTPKIQLHDRSDGNNGADMKDGREPSRRPEVSILAARTRGGMAGAGSNLR